MDDVGEDATCLVRGRCERRELKGWKENWECLTGFWKNMKLKIREQNLSQAHHSVSFCLVSTLFSLIFLSFRTQALSTNNFLKQTVGAITPVTINDCRMNNLWTKGGLSVASNLSFPIKLEELMACWQRALTGTAGVSRNTFLNVDDGFLVTS